MQPPSTTARGAATVAALVSLVMVLGACAGGTAQPSPSGPASAEPSDELSLEPTPAAGEVSFAFASGQPVVTRAMTGIDEAYIHPGAVIEQDGTFHMFANVFTSWPGRVQVPYLTSTDAHAWELSAPDPVLT
ncbi:MAG TPA: hypothetical protein VK838_02490, partial [Candidatus Limnocylindrales bacterium]|nr:hypothetical protein [Candidatus Limnocylindrales bacterium]